MNEGKWNTNKGITMVTLIITIVVMIIIAGTTVYTSLDRFEINKYNKMVNDIELLVDKVNNYYLKYNGLPILRDSENNLVNYTYTTLDFNKNVNDSGSYYILDLAAMEGISLNYGKEGFESPNTSDDVYIINKSSHKIYYVRGIELNDTVYHTIQNDETIEDIIPPSKPEIKIVSGTLNHDGTYKTEVEVEIVPGKNDGIPVNKTEFSLDDGHTWEDITTLTNNILKITEDGTYTIKARSYDTNGNVSEYTIIQLTVTILRVGDYVEYELEYTDIYSENIYNKNNGWRYLGKDDDGNYLIVSTAVPGILYYYYNPGTEKPDWWGEDADVTREYGATYSANSWNYANGGYPNRYAAYGLRYKFSSIPFAYQASGTSVSTKNTGIYRKVGTNTSESITGKAFKVSGVNIVDVHNLTLAELNRATNNATTPVGKRPETSTAVGFKNLTGTANGLFDLQDLEGYTANYSYWLASPYGSHQVFLCFINYQNAGVDNGSFYRYYGVRPVITLSSNTTLTKNVSGIWKIN